jgi:hypothetical protein
MPHRSEADATLASLDQAILPNGSYEKMMGVGERRLYGAKHTVSYRSSLCCCRRLSLVVRMISNSRRTSAFSSSVQGCRVPSGAIQ